MNSSHHSIWKSYIIVAAYLFLAKLAAAGKEVALAWRYGINDTVDAYVFVFNLMQWPTTVLGGILVGLLVPIAASLSISETRVLRELRSYSLAFILLLGMCLCLITWIFFPWLLSWPLLGLSVGQINSGEQMRALVLTIPLSLVASLFAAWTLADNRHVNTLAEALPPLGILFVVLLMGGITPLVFGTVLGLLFQVIFLGASLLSCRQLEKPLFNLEHRYRNMLLGGAGVMILGQGLMSGVVLVDQFAAAGLVPGSLATLGYANRILGLFLTLGSIVVARAVLPIFSAAYVSSNKDYNSLALQWGWKALCFGVVTAGTSILSADWIVKTLFQRGEFGTAESNIVSSALRYGFVQLPFFLCSTVLVNALLAAHRRSLLIPLGGLALATKLGFVLFFLPKLGLKGLLLSTAGAYCITSLAMIILFKRYAWQFAPKE